jgi:hypothetical protein
MHWSSLRVPSPGRDASKYERLRYLRDLQLRSLIFIPILLAPFVVYGLPHWAFGVFGAAYLLEVFSVWRLTQLMRRARDPK